MFQTNTLPETNIFAPKNGGFQVRNLLASRGLAIFRGKLGNENCDLWKGPPTVGNSPTRW